MLPPELVKSLRYQVRSNAPRSSVNPRTVLALYEFWLEKTQLAQEAKAWKPQQ